MPSDPPGTLDRMVALAVVVEPAVPADEPRVVSCDVHTLAAAFEIAYRAGSEKARDDAESFAFLHRTIRNMQRSLRRARPAPREGIEAGLDLMLCAVNERLAAHEQ